MADSLETWSASSFLQAMSEALKFSQVKHIEQVTPGSPLTSGTTDFAILLSDAATLELTTTGGDTVTVGLPAGYQPIRCSAIASVSTGTVYALY